MGLDKSKRIRVEDLKSGEHVTNIEVERDGNTTSYLGVSTKSWAHLATVFDPSELSMGTLKGQKVLDVACGYGTLVHDSRNPEEDLFLKHQSSEAAPVEMYGIDIAGNWGSENWYPLPKDFDPSKNNLVLKNSLKGFFLRGDAAHTGLAGNQFDSIITTFGPFHYENDPELIKVFLTEMSRLLKPGGKIYIWGMSDAAMEILSKPGAFNFKVAREAKRATIILEKLGDPH